LKGNDRTETRGTTLDSNGGEPAPGNAGCRNEGPKHRASAEPHGPSYLCPLAAHLQKAGPAPLSDDCQALTGGFRGPSEYRRAAPAGGSSFRRCRLLHAVQQKGDAARASPYDDEISFSADIVGLMGRRANSMWWTGSGTRAQFHLASRAPSPRVRFPMPIADESGPDATAPAFQAGQS